ncbi:MAG: HAD-IB family hydrolase [Planctomycetota bacterium]|nr:HAD-IB family hydrolase [Planctomycetota bacterium]MDA1140728.1 HAD-IB family hydrolase [Planctomycetota bacterium]
MQRAAFFDVDGTIVKSNIVMPYVHIRRAELSPIGNLFWTPFFLLKALIYIIVDRFDRAKFNRMFYRNYRGRLVKDKEAMARLCFESYISPNIFKQARERIAALKEEGFQIILVTGSLDFLMQPLATELDTDHLIAAKLEERDGRFTGELDGNPVSEAEKVIRIKAYAGTNGINLEASQAYGDSIADLPMLECVREAHAVRPDAKLMAVARERKWQVEEWA